MMPSVKEPLAGLALLVILGFLIWYNRPLENARLFDPYLQDETARFTAPGSYEAWLWQDPFGFDPNHGSGGAARAWALAAKGEKRDDNFSTAVPVNLSCRDSLNNILNPRDKNGKEAPKPVVLAPLVKVWPYTLENKEMRTRQRYAVVAGLVESGYQPVEPGVLHFCSIQENRRKKDGSEKDHREYDMRWERYQYKPNGESEDASKGSPKLDIVVAWIDSGILTDKSKFPVDHDCTNSCNYAFKNLLKEIGKSNKLYLFDVGNVLDSEHSAQVEKHIQCIHNENIKSVGISGNVGDIQLLKLAGMESKEKQVKCNGEASTETSDAGTSGQMGKEGRATCNEPARQGSEGTAQGGNENASEETGSEKIGGQKTGGTGQYENKETGSEKLVRLLAKELTLRGVTHPSHVMTISEHGSENAARLRGSFQECLSKLLAGQECVKPEPPESNPDDRGGDATCCSDEIRNVFYLKSVDGKIPGIRDQYGKDKNNRDEKDRDGKGRNESGRADKGEKVPSIELRHSSPLPLGSGQLDYFHRLAEEMDNAHHVVDLEKRDSGVKAVVILGSDFHDKLLIIQALREKMPHLLILTTDLDRRMLHPKHWRATRNLVVASHFDLRLREKTKEDEYNHKEFWPRPHQDQFSPFRDSQQTNIFYRTWSIAAGDPLSIEESEITFPRRFEVGRNGFIRLANADKNNLLNYHPLDNTRENTVKELGLLFLIAVSLILFHVALRPWANLYTRYLLISTTLIFAFVFLFCTDFFTNEPKEPLSFTDGVSLWPTLFIQTIASLLAITFFFQFLCELEGNICRLNRRYFSTRQFAVCPSSNEPDECEPWLVRRWRGWKMWIRSTSLMGSLTFCFLIGTIIAYALNDVYPSKVPFSWCFGILAVGAFIYILFFWKEVYISIKQWAESSDWIIANEEHRNSIRRWSESSDWILSDDEYHESVLWNQYYILGRLGYRVARAVGIWLIFAIIETLLAYLLPPWPLPWRGATDWISQVDGASWIGVLSFIATMFLLFFVLDAVRLNFYWIRKLRTQHPLFTVELPSHDYPASRYRLERMVLLVAERTQAVDRLIYYPMFCIMLMLLAKITYFDNQEFPLSKGITFGAAISLLFLSGFVLRREADELRLCVRRRVRDMRAQDSSIRNCREIDETISRIDAIDEGAFQPMLEQPVMQALLIMLASVGLFAGEYLKVFG